MTDSEFPTTAVATLDAPPRPKRPHRRTRPEPAPSSTEAQLMSMLQAQQERIAQLESGLLRTVPAEAAPPPTWAGATELTEFQIGLQQKTEPTPKNFENRSRPYNHPTRWFCRPDGEIVKLQGSPEAIALYLQKGCHLLSASEVEAWETTERQKVVAAQRKRASLITGLRRLVSINPVLSSGLDASWNAALSDMTFPELEQVWKGFADQLNQPGLKVPTTESFDQRRLDQLDARDQALDGVELNAMDEKVAAAMAQGRGHEPGRLVEATPTNARTFV